MERRLISPFIICIVIAVLGFGITLMGIGSKDDPILFIPGNAAVDYSIVLLVPYFFCIIAVLISPLLAIGFLNLHRLIKKDKVNYFILPLEKKMSTSRIVKRAIIPSLLALNIGIYLSFYSEITQYFDTPYITQFGNLYLVEIIALLIGAPIACILIAPIWALESSGLMCSKKIEAFDYPVSANIESVGSFYYNILKDYVGISIVISYLLIIYQTMILLYKNWFLFIVIIIVDPLFIIFWMIPLSTFLEFRLNSINKNLLSKYEKMGINLTPQTIKIEAK